MNNFFGKFFKLRNFSRKLRKEFSTKRLFEHDEKICICLLKKKLKNSKENLK